MLNNASQVIVGKERGLVVSLEYVTYGEMTEILSDGDKKECGWGEIPEVWAFVTLLRDKTLLPS